MSGERRRRAGGSRRAEVLVVAVEVLIERGYARTRFQDVASASGVAVSTLQGYFGSREDMLVEVLLAATDGEVAVMEKAVADLRDPWQRVVALIDRGLATPTPVWRMLWEFWIAAAHDAELRAHSHVLQARYRAPFESAVRDGVAAGRFTPRHPVEQVVDVLIAALDGLCVPRVLEQPRPDLTNFREVLVAQVEHALGADGTTS